MTNLRWLVACGVIVAVGVAGSSASAGALRQEGTPAADCPATTMEENKELVRGWFAALSEGAGADVAALAAPDVIYHDPSPQNDPQSGGAAEWADGRQQDYPDMTVTVEQIIAEGDMVASSQRYTGTQAGDIEEGMGIPATGLETEWLSMAHFRIECGKIAEIWAVADDLGRLQRLGIISDEELQSMDAVATPSP